MVKMHKLVAKYGTAYSAANRKQVCDAAIRTLLMKHMQHHAVDSRGPDAAAAATPSPTCSAGSQKMLFWQNVLAPRSPVLSAPRSPPGSSLRPMLSPRRRLDPRRLPRLLVLNRLSLYLNLATVFSSARTASRTSTSQSETSSSSRQKASPTRRGARAAGTRPMPIAKRKTPDSRSLDSHPFPLSLLLLESSPLVQWPHTP